MPFIIHRASAARRRHAGLIAAVVPLIALSACAKKDAKTELGRVRSWTVTTSFAAGLHGVGATNRAVTLQLLQRAKQAHANGEAELARLARTDSQRVAVRLLLDSLQQGILKLERAAQ